MAVEAFKGETKRPIKFTTGLDLEGSTLTILAYDSEGNETDITATSTTSLGNASGEETTAFIEIPDTLSKGTYNIKVETTEVVASRDKLIVYGEDPFDL